MEKWAMIKNEQREREREKEREQRRTNTCQSLEAPPTT